MSLISALGAAVSGLRTTQAGINVVSQNVANADSVGYTRRQLTPVQAVAGGETTGVRSGDIQRILDTTVQRQLRLETSGGAYTSLAAQYADALDRLFGQPGGAGSLDGNFNAFATALQRLADNPGDYSTRAGVMDAGRALAGQIASIADGVQALRSDAEGRIATDVDRANQLLTGIAGMNSKIATLNGASSAALLDERDGMIDQLSQLVDVKALPNQDGTVDLMTTAGQTLVTGTAAVTLKFDSHGTLGPTSLYAPKPAASGVGRIVAVTGTGMETDLTASGAIRSGEIAAALEMRDTTLVQAQRQLDEMAAGMARAMSDRAVAGTPATSGGFDIDLAGLKAGNAVTIDYAVGGTPRRVILMPTDGAAPNPIPASDTSDPTATVIRVDTSGAGGITGASAIAAINIGLTSAGIALTAAPAPPPATATSLHMDASGATTLTGLSAGITTTTLNGGQNPLPFFTDAGKPFTGSFESGSQLTGFAQRITVNPQVRADSNLQGLVVSSPTTAQGDSARPQFLVDALTKSARIFSAAAGVGGVAAPYTATVGDFARRVVETQGSNAEAAQRLNEGQKVALSNIQSRFSETAGVNIDQEMAQLVQLQSAYGANARVMTAVRDMLDMLMRI